MIGDWIEHIATQRFAGRLPELQGEYVAYSLRPLCNNSVFAALQARHTLGIEKYGDALRFFKEEDDWPLDPVQEMLQELLDAVLYGYQGVESERYPPEVKRVLKDLVAKNIELVDTTLLLLAELRDRGLLPNDNTE